MLRLKSQPPTGQVAGAGPINDKSTCPDPTTYGPFWHTGAAEERIQGLSTCRGTYWAPTLLLSWVARLPSLPRL